jgi:hypothetical protein
MNKDFKAQTYIVDEHLPDTLTWLCHHQDSFDSFTMMRLLKNCWYIMPMESIVFGQVII